jgi:hypothetical protein
MYKQIVGQKAGRNPVITDDVCQKLEKSLAAGFSVSLACYFAGISRSSYYNYRAEDKEFANKMRLAEEWSTYKARITILKAIDAGDVAASRFWLERKCRVEFAPPKSY